MEKQIVDIILQRLHDNYVNDLYFNHSTEFTFIPKLDIDKLPFNVIMDFSEDYFNLYKNTLISNGLVYAIKNKQEEFLNFFLENKNNLEKLLETEKLFKIKLCEYGIKNIVNKHFDKSIDDTNIINNNPKYFDYQLKPKVQSITNLFRDIILDFLLDFEEDEEIILETIFTSNKYDKKLILENSDILNEKNIKYFKYILFKLILSDCYLYLENKTEYDDETEIITSRNMFDEDEYEDEYEDEDDKEYIEKEICTSVRNYLKYCIKHKDYFNEDFFEDRLNLFSMFLTYNSFVINKPKDILNVLKDKNKKLTLRKINPMFILDMLDN